MTPAVNLTPTTSEEGDKNTNVPKRVAKLLDSRIENDKDALTALKDLDSFFPVNSLHSRRCLRSQIEKRSINLNQNFLEAFRKVKEGLDEIYQDVNSMNDAVNSMSAQLSATKAQTHQLIEHTTKLQVENDKLAMKEQVAIAFMKAFQLSEEELQILRTGEVSVEFFQVLERVAKIHKDCNTLVSSCSQTLALEIMEQMTIYQEAALERLYRWAQVHCKNIDTPASSQLFSLAMSKLQDRSTLFKYVVGAYCTHKRSVLVREFLEALTKGVPDQNGTLQPPLEMSADDPHTYVARMLSFLLTALENHNLSVLFSQCDKIDVVEETKEALAQISDGVVTPLKTRVERVVDHPELPLPVLCSIVYLLNQHTDSFIQQSPRKLWKSVGILVGDRGTLLGNKRDQKVDRARAYPDRPPFITGARDTYSVGDFITVNCTSGRSNPEPVLAWYINGMKAESYMLDLGSPKVAHASPDHSGHLYSRSLGMRTRAEKSQFIGKHTSIELKCTSTVADMPPQYVQVEPRLASATANQKLAQEMFGRGAGNRVSSALFLMTFLLAYILT